MLENPEFLSSCLDGASRYNRSISVDLKKKKLECIASVLFFGCGYGCSCGCSLVVAMVVAALWL